MWLDEDGYGVQDAGETTGLAGVTVTFTLHGTGAQVGSPFVTPSTGLYSFSGLTPGSYKVCFTTPPAGYAFSPTGQGLAATDPAMRGSRRAVCSATFILASNETNNTLDAGLYQSATVGDPVWRDTNGNGIQDAGETRGFRVSP